MNDKLERIAELVQEGYTSGYYPYWVLTAEWEDDVTDLGLETIASQIREGYTSGSCYDDIIGLISWSIEIDNSDDDNDSDDNDEYSEGNGYSYYNSEDEYLNGVQ